MSAQTDNLPLVPVDCSPNELVWTMTAAKYFEWSREDNWKKARIFNTYFGVWPNVQKLADIVPLYRNGETRRHYAIEQPVAYRLRGVLSGTVGGGSIDVPPEYKLLVIRADTQTLS